MLKRSIFVFIFVLFFFIPMQVLAVDYKITDVEINAYLQEDGNVRVEERHTYSFSGEFGGIIRVLIPKEGSQIANLEAFEGSAVLNVEANETEYRIYRPGADETITVDLVYDIYNGVEVYADVAEFYWPFFDKSNESTYENMTIHVFPPEETVGEVIAFGYDEAFEKEVVLEGGQVQFQMGMVPAKSNGDIRVAYDAALFPAAPIKSDELMRGEILGAQQQLMDEVIAQAERRESVATVGGVVLAVAGLVLLVFLLRAWGAAVGRKQALRRELAEFHGVPEERLSMVGTIFFTNYGQLLPETVAAALLDLVRKGHVKKIDEDRFQLVNRSGLLESEEALVRWLFDEIGSEGEFSFEGLTEYTMDKGNHEKYQLLQADWNKAVRAEVKAAELSEKRAGMRWTAGLFSVILIPFSISFVVNDLIGLFLGALGLLVALLGFALGYHPRTWDGAKIALEWRKFKEQFPKMGADEWQRLSEDDKMRAFIYGLGTNEKSLKKKNESLVKGFKLGSGNRFGRVSDGGASYPGQLGQSWQPGQSATVYGFDPTWIFVAGAASSNFKTAERTTAPATGGDASGGSFGGGGAGTGGGGGGSGAF
ncbi:hypothetical protein J2S74_000043 [Evansella vedderi]|uniref:DUF2207 domain-containing protein n=1 Tax=Evansella vedderi TaxID=38282 RepID=A0ABT9ZPM5_9BACI|nr:DUF2207 domain-containing protein [Evansella vedderi]MDQ0252671.1 hypothetical protein [Evansella vedderi]